MKCSYFEALHIGMHAHAHFKLEHCLHHSIQCEPYIQLVEGLRDSVLSTLDGWLILGGGAHRPAGPDWTPWCGHTMIEPHVVGRLAHALVGREEMKSLNPSKPLLSQLVSLDVYV